MIKKHKFYQNFSVVIAAYNNKKRKAIVSIFQVPYNIRNWGWLWLDICQGKELIKEPQDF